MITAQSPNWHYQVPMCGFMLGVCGVHVCAWDGQYIHTLVVLNIYTGGMHTTEKLYLLFS